MDLEVDTIHGRSLETLPFALAVVVEEARDVLGVVASVRHEASIRAPQR